LLYLFSGPDFLFATSFFPARRHTFWLVSSRSVRFRN
jgi:hypothetical protein